MTIKELSQLYHLNREIEQEKHRLQELEAAATDTAVKISGLPHVGGISDKTAIAAQIADCRAVIEAKVQLSVVEYNRLNRYIANVQDSLTRQIMVLRFVNGMSWNQVAMSVGGGNTEDSVKKVCYRYVKRNFKSCPECPD